MEKNGKIVLIDKELSEGQQKLSRFIEYYTKVPFTGETYNEWSMWVALNKEYAEHEKAKACENASRDASVKRQQKPRDKKRGREIAVDAEKLYAVIKEIGETNGHICALCGFGHSYLSHVKQRGWMYESDIAKLTEANIDAGDYVTDAWYRATHNLDESPLGAALNRTKDALVEAFSPLMTPEPVEDTTVTADVVVITVDDRLKAFATVMGVSAWSFVMDAIDNRINEIRGRLA